MDSTLEVLFILCVVISFYLIAQQFYRNNHQITYTTEEGFTQQKPFSSKQNGQLYDEFYASMHDRIHKSRQQSKYDLIQILENTQPSANSVFLDVGSGTGHLVNRLQQIGFRAYGIDSSEAMVQHSTKKHPDSEFKCGDVKKTMEFDPETFSHILCTHFTFYEIRDKPMFVKNCKRWLKIGGYMVLHLVDKMKFDTIIPIGKIANTNINANIETDKNIDSSIDTNIGTNTNKRILSSSVSLPTMKYTNKYVFQENDLVKRIETFTCKKTKYVRQQELEMDIPPVEDTLHMIKSHGFHVKGYATYDSYNGDKHQYLYFFEKTDV